MNETIPYLPGLSPVAGKELCARFDGGRLSSDGGVLLLRGIEQNGSVLPRALPVAWPTRAILRARPTATPT